MALVTYFSSKLYLSNLQRVCKLSVFRTSIRFTTSIGSPVQCHSPRVCHIRRFPKKSCYKIFLLLIYYVILWTCLYGFITHLIFLHISITFNSLAPARKKGNYLLLVALLHFFDNFVITPKPFPMAGVFEGSKEVEIWESKIWAVWWWGGKFHACFHLQHTSPYHAIFTSPCAFARKRIFPRRCSSKRDIQN